MLLYGMNGGTNIYADVYKVFGDLVVTMYPELLPSYPPIEKILDLTFIQKVAERTTNMPAATQTKINLNAPVTQVVSVREWSIEFESGKATLTLDGVNTLEQLKRELSIGSGGNLAIEIHGYTDNTGTPEGNMLLGGERAETVKSWLTAKDAVNIGSRIKNVVSHGQNDAKTSNATAAGRAANRRVVIKQVK
jgi:outer membrane protein OmpA-like peptidoglycan-associated protein